MLQNASLCEARQGKMPTPRNSSARSASPRNRGERTSALERCPVTSVCQEGKSSGTASARVTPVKSRSSWFCRTSKAAASVANCSIGRPGPSPDWAPPIVSRLLPGSDKQVLRVLQTPGLAVDRDLRPSRRRDSRDLRYAVIGSDSRLQPARGTRPMSGRELCPGYSTQAKKSPAEAGLSRLARRMAYIIPPMPPMPPMSGIA